MKVEIYRNIFRQWRWRVKAGNNRKIGASTESYFNRKDCESNLKQLAHAITHHFETTTDGN